MKSRVVGTVSFCRQGSKSLQCLPRKWPCQQVTRQMTFLTNRLWAPKFTANCTHLGWAKQTQPCATHPAFLLCWARLTALIEQPVQKCVPSLRDTCKHCPMPNYFKILYFQNGSQHKLLAHSANVQATNACSAAEGHTLVSCLKSE